MKFAFAPAKDKILRDPFPEYTIHNPMIKVIVKILSLVFINNNEKDNFST